MISLKSLRNDHNITMDEMASIINTSRQTYSRIEKEQSELSISQAVRLTDHFNISIDVLIETDTRCQPVDDFEIDRDKYYQIIKTFISCTSWSDWKITKTKLAKLCYLLDFTWYYDHLNSLTWLQYRRIAHWPVPDAYFTALEMMENDESISIEQKGKTYLISNITDPSDRKLSNEESQLIKKISDKWKDSNTREIVDFTHEQLPWKLCDEKEIIPYELIIQEDPAHVF